LIEIIDRRDHTDSMAGVVTLATTGYLDVPKKERAAPTSRLIRPPSTPITCKRPLPDTQEGLKVLVPDFVNHHHRSWGHPYQYLSPQKHALRDHSATAPTAAKAGTGADANSRQRNPNQPQKKYRREKRFSITLIELLVAIVLLGSFPPPPPSLSLFAPIPRPPTQSTRSNILTPPPDSAPSASINRRSHFRSHQSSLSRREGSKRQ